MKRLVVITSLLVSSLGTVCAQQASHASAKGKSAPATTACLDTKVHASLVSINADLERKNQRMVLFNTFNVESNYYAPLMVNLEKGKTYKINYVAGTTASRYELRLLSKDRKEIFVAKAKGANASSNILTKEFVAPYTGAYSILVHQKTKGQGCAGVSVFQVK